VAENSKIEWCDHTFNPWVGCQKVSPGCDHCYAEGWAKRSGLVQWGPHADRRRTSEVNWRKPLKWAKDARGTGKRPKVFCASLADVWDNQVPTEWRRDLFNLIYATPELDWLLLTKRPENIRKMLPGAIGEVELWPWPNVWLGTTCEDDAHYRRRWPILQALPAAVRFISYEPAIGPLVDLWAGTTEIPDWIICGGESGSKSARVMDLRWARDVREMCKPHGGKHAAYFFKQTTNKGPIPDDLMVRQFPR
jgi:protein gp37